MSFKNVKKIAAILRGKNLTNEIQINLKQKFEDN